MLKLSPYLWLSPVPPEQPSNLSTNIVTPTEICFGEVRSFEAFKHLHVGMISPIKRKTLPEIAKVVGLDQEQALHHFLIKSPWEIQELRKQRLDLILQVLKGRRIFLIIDETGDKKK